MLLQCLWIAVAVLFLIPSSGARDQSLGVSPGPSSLLDSQDLFFFFTTRTRVSGLILFAVVATSTLLERSPSSIISCAITRTGDVHHFDPRLYDVLSDLTFSIGHPGGEIDIVCGYRTPSTNEALRAHSTRVSKNSLIQAEAIDLRMPGVDTRKGCVLATGGGNFPLG
jgi:hypothetical protein